MKPSGAHAELERGSPAEIGGVFIVDGALT